MGCAEKGGYCILFRAIIEMGGFFWVMDVLLKLINQ
jgi:hypothetical protein